MRAKSASESTRRLMPTVASLKDHGQICPQAGSPESKNALRWAVEEACLRGASVRAIHVYDDPVLRWEAYGPAAGNMYTSEQFAELEESLSSRAAESQGQAEALVEHAVAEVDDLEDVKVDAWALRGRPAVDAYRRVEGC
jgi:nucleotide-binding universal stress UspA family protein